MVICLNVCNKISGLLVYKYILICVNVELKLFMFVIILFFMKCKEK